MQAPTSFKSLLGYLLQSSTLWRLDNTCTYTLRRLAFESFLTPETQLYVWCALGRKEISREGWLATTKGFAGERSSWSHEDCRSICNIIGNIIGNISISLDRPNFPSFLKLYKDKAFLPFLFARRRLGSGGEKQDMQKIVLQQLFLPAAVEGSPWADKYKRLYNWWSLEIWQHS